MYKKYRKKSELEIKCQTLEDEQKNPEIWIIGIPKNKIKQGLAKMDAKIHNSRKSFCSSKKKNI